MKKIDIINNNKINYIDKINNRAILIAIVN